MLVCPCLFSYIHCMIIKQNYELIQRISEFLVTPGVMSHIFMRLPKCPYYNTAITLLDLWVMWFLNAFVPMFIKLYSLYDDSPNYELIQRISEFLVISGVMSPIFMFFPVLPCYNTAITLLDL
jgi:hypothetical protein